MSDTPLSHVGHRAPVWPTSAFRVDGPIRHVDLSDDRASRRSPWVITGAPPLNLCA